MEVKLIDKMGSDLTCCNAARVSFNKESDWENATWGHPDFEEPNYLGKSDQKLISYLAKHNHWTPFGHVQITLWQKMPIFVARQFAKHTVGFVTNEVSRRYVDEEPQFYLPEESEIRTRPDGSIKQGSGGTHMHSEDYRRRMAAFNELARRLYNRMIEDDVAPEQARMVLPQSMYTEMYTTGSLAAWARAYKLRSDPHAQKEIQNLAGMWNSSISGIPELQYSWKALTE